MPKNSIFSAYQLSGVSWICTQKKSLKDNFFESPLNSNVSLCVREVQAANGKASNGSNGGAYTNGDSPSGSSRSSSEKHLLTHCCKYLINSTRKK